MKRRLKRLLWFVAAIAISTSVYFTIRFGLRPKPIPVMNPTSFESSEQIGAVLYRRLYQDVRAERVLILGSDPDLRDSAEIWNGFLKTAAADDVKPDTTYTLDKDETQAQQLPEKIREEIASGHRVVVLAKTKDATHLLQDTFVKRLEQAAGHPVLALSTVNLNLVPEEVQEMHTECVTPGSPDDGEKHMKCAKARVSAALLKKLRSAPTKIWSAIERHGLKEYLVFVHR